MKRPDLLKAAINCPHQITEKSVILHFDEKAHGHNALQQLGNRLERELHTAYKSNDDLVVIRTAITDDKNDIEGLRSAIRVLTPNFQTWIGKVLDELVTLRAQADAGPFWHAVVSKSAPVIDKAIRRLDVAEEYADKCRENYPDVTVVPLYTHPSLPAAQGLSDDEITQVWLDHGGSLNGNNFRSFARAILSRAATVAEPSEEAASYKRMFEDAVRSLAAIDEALGIDPDEAGGAEPILQAIEELKAAQQQAEPVGDERIKRDAARFADAFAEGWVPLLPEDTNRTVELLRALAAQSGQRAGVAEDVIEAAAKKLAEDFDYPWEHMPAQGKDDFRAKVRSIAAMLAAPTQQQEGM